MGKPPVVPRKHALSASGLGYTGNEEAASATVGNLAGGNELCCAGCGGRRPQRVGDGRGSDRLGASGQESG